MRDQFRDEMDDIGAGVAEMIRLVAVAIEQATGALLDGDLARAERVIEADSLGYLSLDALVEAARQDTAPGRDETARPATGPGLCSACFTGSYPIPILPIARRSGTVDATPVAPVTAGASPVEVG